MTITMTLRNTGNCLVIVPSYARPQKVEAMKNGSSGMMILETMARTTFWISSSSASRRLDLVQVIARPTISDSASALMTFMIAGDLELEQHLGQLLQTLDLRNDGQVRNDGIACRSGNERRADRRTVRQNERHDQHA